MTDVTTQSGNESAPASTLVIVDDEKAIRLLLKEFFKNKYSTIHLSDGFECLEYLQTNRPPAVVVIDLQMPGLSGLETIKAIRLNTKWDKVGILVLSSQESSEQRITCLTSGADDYVVKPFNPAELEARVRAITRRSSRD